MTFSTLIENRAQSANVRHTQDVGFLCSTCWHHLPVQSTNGFGTGYGSDNEDRLHCYQCCGKRDREELKDRRFTVEILGRGFYRVTKNNVMALIRTR